MGTEPTDRADAFASIDLHVEPLTALELCSGFGARLVAYDQSTGEPCFTSIPISDFYETEQEAGEPSSSVND